jgi:hypothetical protein
MYTKHDVWLGCQEPTDHEKAEWSRVAQACYASGNNALGHRFSAYASLERGARMPADLFDNLQSIYRTWLVFGRLPEAQS